MKILIASDSFKDALDSFGVCDAIDRGVRLCNASIETIVFPLADGGERTSDILMYHLGGHKKKVTVSDPLLRLIQTDYVISDDGETAFIALAKSSGLQLLADHERDPMCTSTFGFGEMIMDAIDAGVGDIVLSIGGSATNDGGMGMAAALGFRFYDAEDQLLVGVGKDLGNVARMEVDHKVKDRLEKIKFTTICDVTNPLYGSAGAAHTFAAQKGAMVGDILLLDKGLTHFAQVMDATYAADMAGAGAAGGVGFGSVLFLNATLKKGIKLIMEMTHFENHVRMCDLVITGEGRLDGQTAFGKLVQGVTSIASKYHKPVIALCGAIDATHEDIKNLGLQAAFSISTGPQSLADALKDTAINLELSAFNLMRCLER